MDLKTGVFRCVCWIVMIILALPAAASAEKRIVFRIGTGGETGVYYPVGKLIANGLTRPAGGKTGVAGCIAVAQSSAGSIENIRTIVSGETEAGLVQADVAAMAFHGTGVYKGKSRKDMIRAVASLYPEKFQIVARQDANIRQIGDLRGKRISMDEQGSGTLAVMRIVLSAHGLRETDLRPVYLKPVFTEGEMMAGDMAGFVMMAGVPMDAVLRLSHIGLSIVPIPLSVAEKIRAQYPYIVPGIIPGGIYPAIPETPTIQVHALMAVSSETDADLVFQVTAALWSRHTLGLLRQGHAQGAAITPETALKGLSIPLHRGAARYYREQGLLKE